jgi:hypothetical protein
LALRVPDRMVTYSTHHHQNDNLHEGQQGDIQVLEVRHQRIDPVVYQTMMQMHMNTMTTMIHYATDGMMTDSTTIYRTWMIASWPYFVLH